jgi:hypothetical protein
VTATDRAIAEHLLSCSTALYEVLGESAPTFSNDAYVIRAYEMSRAFGALALETREYLGDASPVTFDVLIAVLRASVNGDESGALAMFAVAMAVGPRLLVSLVDARAALVENEELRTLLNHASQVCVREIRLIGDVAKDQAPIEDPAWQVAAHDLLWTFDSSGCAESLGISR